MSSYGFSFDDCMDVTTDINSDLGAVPEPRWLRKQRQQQSTGGIKVNNNLVNLPPQSTVAQDTCCDRFIPNRRSQDMEVSRFNLMNNMDMEDDESEESKASGTQDENKMYQNNLEQRLFDGTKIKESKILALTEKAPAPTKDWQSEMRVLYTHNKSSGGINYSQTQQRKNSTSRHIPQAPSKILDAPGLVEDYYLNLLDWSSRNTLAVALSDSIYLWNAETGSINKLMSCQQQNENTPDNYITSLSWTADGNNIAVGTNYNEVQIWDVNRAKQVRTMRGHSARPGALSWNSYVLSSGGKDGRIINNDVRIAQHIVTTLSGHGDFEVCGLKWSHDGTQLASGGNDNVLNIWSKETCLGSAPATPKFQIRDHTAAVKALAWCPWQSNLLASGGGTSDRRIMFWNTQTGNCLNSIDTKSQVCSLVWSKHDREIVSSHGFSHNQLCVWKYPSLVKVTELTGHTSRVLHLAQSPDGATVVSAAGDETLRFWNVFSAPDPSTNTVSIGNGARTGKDGVKGSMLGMRNIR
jgi:cell division cycle protein 20 (cofactor of APC complex)